METRSYLFPTNTSTYKIYKIATILSWNMQDLHVTVDPEYGEENDPMRYRATITGEKLDRVATGILFCRFMSAITKE